MIQSNRHTVRSGFTIFELLIVLVIIGVLSGIGVVSLSPNRSNIELAKNLLVMKAFEMRQRAISNTTNSKLEIVPGSGSFVIDADIKDSTDSAAIIVLPEGIIVERADGMTATFTVRFQDNGTVTATSIGGIVLKDATSNKAYTLSINRTGAMKIE